MPPVSPHDGPVQTVFRKGKSQQSLGWSPSDGYPSCSGGATEAGLSRREVRIHDADGGGGLG